MQWSDNAIVLFAHKHGESSAIIQLMTSEHGLYNGMVRNVSGKAKRGIYHAGNKVFARWNARLMDQLGMLECELVQPVAALLLDSRIKLAVLCSATSLIEKILVEREPEPLIYISLTRLIDTLYDDTDYLTNYARLELDLLSVSGFGLDIERCAVTGTTENLCYVSPKSGRAVALEIGKDYHAKMLVLPEFLKAKPGLSPGEASPDAIRQALELCGYFLHARVFNPKGLPLPSPRRQLLALLNR